MCISIHIPSNPNKYAHTGTVISSKVERWHCNFVSSRTCWEVEKVCFLFNTFFASDIRWWRGLGVTRGVSGACVTNPSLRIRAPRSVAPHVSTLAKGRSHLANKSRIIYLHPSSRCIECTSSSVEFLLLHWLWLIKYINCVCKKRPTTIIGFSELLLI